MPKNMDTSSARKYALVVFVYGAPEYQNVDERWTTDFVEAYLPSSYDIITARVLKMPYPGYAKKLKNEIFNI